MIKVAFKARSVLGKNYNQILSSAGSMVAKTEGMTGETMKFWKLKIHICGLVTLLTFNTFGGELKCLEGPKIEKKLLESSKEGLVMNIRHHIKNAHPMPYPYGKDKKLVTFIDNQFSVLGKLRLKNGLFAIVMKSNLAKLTTRKDKIWPIFNKNKVTIREFYQPIDNLHKFEDIPVMSILVPLKNKESSQKNILRINSMSLNLDAFPKVTLNSDFTGDSFLCPQFSNVLDTLPEISDLEGADKVVLEQLLNSSARNLSL